NGRYMVDFETYRRSRGHNLENWNMENVEEYLPQEVVESSLNPSGDLALLLPSTTYGFGFHDKKWRKLNVEYASEIIWNRTAFEMLVLPTRQKEILGALVLNHSTSTKTIAGQGTSVVIVLHGGPGTGKTFAAEALAELGLKPLYRLTSGDIGVELDKMEKNLNEAFYFGSIWDAVILFDESDVFLGQRTRSDFSRNAVVSINLQTLDQYRGLVMLTSDRVAMLDVAVQSRIQVAIEFKLDQQSRAQVWHNAIKRFCFDNEKNEVSVDADSMIASILDFAKLRLTGREIWNVLRTAKQLASYRCEPLKASHIESSIEITKAYSDYLEGVTGVDAERLAKMNQWR
ncbi:P-loop containing nucleoside triphosphate hydrolase protein, partial [Fusarium oxysporum]